MVGQRAELILLFDSIRSSQFKRLLGLQRLVLYNNNLSGPIGSWIGSLRSLIQLDLAVNHFTGPIPKEVRNTQITWKAVLKGSERPSLAAKALGTGISAAD